jgi:hypothetical protein
MVTVNLFGDHPSYAKNLKAMKHAFADVIALPEVHDGNVVALAFRDKPALDFALLHERADAIRTATKLPARSWVNGIQAAQGQKR